MNMNMNVNNVVAQKSEPEEEEEDDHTMLRFFKLSNSPFGGRTRKKPFSNPSITEKGQSSNSKNDDDEYPPPPSHFICEICKEPKSPKKTFSIKGSCRHSYCTDCVTNYVASKLQDNVLRIGCPDPVCRGYLDPEHCRPIIPHEVFDRWRNALRDQVVVIVRSHRIYCPYEDCSTMMRIDDGVRKSECPNCWRLLCAKCRVPWHLGIECWEFQRLIHKNESDEEDVMLTKPAQKKRRGRCPNCTFCVDKTRHKCTRCGKYFNDRKHLNNRNIRFQFMNYYYEGNESLLL